MPGHRLRYLAVLATGVLYYLASGQWLSWMLLVICLGLPWLSLVLSLPAIARLRVSATGCRWVEMEEDSRLWLLGSCPMPMPPFRGSIRLESCFTGCVTRYAPETGLDTRHCGGFQATAEQVRVYDYLGLFRFRVRPDGNFRLCIRPRPVPYPGFLPPDAQRVSAWRPKPNGSSDDWELRPYRPGDSLNRMHWKLSAKTGTLIHREAREPILPTTVVSLSLTGSAEVLDRKLGQLLWLGNALLPRPFSLRAQTGDGETVFSIADTQGLHAALDTLLLSPLAAREAEAWYPGLVYRIGGTEDEA